MQLLKILSLLIFSYGVHANSDRWVDFRCDADDCLIPYDGQGLKNGLEVCYGHKDKKEKIKEVNWVKDKRQGVARCFNKGKVSVEVFYQNDIINGLFIQYNYDSSGTRIQLIKSGIPDGYEFSVDSKDKVTSILWCIHRGKVDSPDLSYCSLEDYGKYNQPLKNYKIAQDQKAKINAAQLAKRMNGPQKTTYASGKLRSTYTNVDGRMTGLYTSHYENGTIQEQCEYKTDKRHGKCTQYDELGNVDLKEIYKEGQLFRGEKYFDNGKMSESRQRDDKNGFCVTRYYDNGVNESQFCESLSSNRWWHEFQGPYTSWTNTGKIISKGSFKKGLMIGRWDYFNEDGSYYSQLTYSDKGILEKSIMYYNFKIENNQRRPYLHRIETDYFPDGSVKKESELPGHSGTKPNII